MSIKVTVEFTDEEWERRQTEALGILLTQWINAPNDGTPEPTLDSISPPNILRLAVRERPRKHGGKREKLTDRAVS